MHVQFLTTRVRISIAQEVSVLIHHLPPKIQNNTRFRKTYVKEGNQTEDTTTSSIKANSRTLRHIYIVQQKHINDKSTNEKQTTTMGIEHLLYTPQQDPTNHHPTTMVMLVDGDAYNNKKQGTGQTSAANIVDSFDVFKYSNGNQGELVRPNKSEISHVFGTTNVDEIADFMLQNGHLHGGKKKAVSHEEVEADPHSRMHVHRSGRPL